MANIRRKLGIIFTVAIILLVLGITLSVLWSSIFNKFLSSELTLTEKSKTYKFWIETPIPMYLKFYLFNWTNANECVSQKNVKPHFIEMGPYVFRQIDRKVNLVWNNNGTVTFQRQKTWHFDETLSNGNLSDVVTNLNPVVATTAYMLRYKLQFLRKAINKLMLVLEERLIIKCTVAELLFDGFNDTLLEIGTKIGAKMNMSIMPYEKFGWFYSRNNSANYDGTFNMLTGVDDLLNLGTIKEWNFMNKTNKYYGSCGDIQGTNGDLWPPLPDNETISIFISDICTNLDLVYDNSTTFEGLNGNKFISDKKMFDNGTEVDSRRCYCHDKECQPSGALNISTCKFGAPAFVTLPHFYLADPIYRSQISGMNPTKEHETSILVEPNTGIPLQVKAQLQINLLIQPYDSMSIFENVSKLYIPMIWFTQEANLTTELASQVKFLLVLPTLGHITGIGIAVIGLLILSIGIYLIVRWKLRGEEGQVLISKNEGDRSNSEG